MQNFWLSPKTIGFILPLLVGVALEIGGWVSHAIAYALFAVAFVWGMCAFGYWRKTKRGRQPNTIALEKVNRELAGRLEDISQADANLIVAMSIEMEVIHGYNDLTGLFADRASGVPLNELKTRPCSQCGIPRNQRGKHDK